MALKDGLRGVALGNPAIYLGSAWDRMGIALKLLHWQPRAMSAAQAASPRVAMMIPTAEKTPLQMDWLNPD